MGDVYAVITFLSKSKKGNHWGLRGIRLRKSTLALSLMGYYFPPLHYTSGEIPDRWTQYLRMDADEVRKLVLEPRSPTSPRRR